MRFLSRMEDSMGSRLWKRSNKSQASKEAKEQGSAPRREAIDLNGSNPKAGNEFAVDARADCGCEGGVAGG